MPKLESAGAVSGRSGSRRARAVRVSSSLAEINVVPLVDVMLVLLIIFMVAAPMMQQGFPVNLARSRRAQTADTEPITVTVPLTFRSDRRVRLGQEAVPLRVLSTRIQQALVGRPTKNVTLAGEGSLTWQELVSVMDEIKLGGVENVLVQTQPGGGSR